MSGWYALPRGAFDDDIFADEPFTERDAYRWLFENVAYTDTRHRVGGGLVDVPRGSLCQTLRGLATAWRWGSDYRVRTFLDRLENAGKIQRKAIGNGNAKKTLITLCDYDVSRETQPAENAPKTQTPTHQKRTKVTRESSEAKASGAVIDPAAVLFGQCLAYLMRATGKPEKACRTLLGGWKSKFGTAATVDACARSEREAAVEPVAFITACLGKARPHDRRTLSVVEDLDQRGFRDLENDQRAADRRGDNRPPAPRQPADDVPRMLAAPAQENGPVPVGDVRAGPGTGVLPPLRMVMGGFS